MKQCSSEFVEMSLENFFLGALGQYPKAAMNSCQIMQANGITTVNGLLRLGLARMKEIFSQNHIAGDVDVHIRMQVIEEYLKKNKALVDPLSEKYMVNFQELANKETPVEKVHEILVAHIKKVLESLSASDEVTANQFKEYVEELFRTVPGGKLRWEKDYSELLKEVIEAPSKRVQEVKDDILSLIKKNTADNLVKEAQKSLKPGTKTKK